MDQPRAYVETTIPSFYHTTRQGVAALAQRAWTRRWWILAQERYELVTSDAVLDELRDGEYPSREAAVDLVRDLPRLELTRAVAEIVNAYVRHRQHLTNANKFTQIRRVNSLLGLFVPAVVNPLELLGEDDEPRP